MNKASQRTEGTDYPLLLPRQPFLGGELIRVVYEDQKCATKKTSGNSKQRQVSLVFSSKLENNAKV